MPAHIGGDEHAALRHRLEWLQRRHEIRQAARPPRIDEHVDQIVVALHFGVRDASGEDDALGQPERSRPFAQYRLVRAATQQEHGKIGTARQEARDGIEQDRMEDYLMLRIQAGDKLYGTYPPNDQARADFEAWQKAGGRPEDVMRIRGTGPHA